MVTPKRNFEKNQIIFFIDFSRTKSEAIIVKFKLDRFCAHFLEHSLTFSRFTSFGVISILLLNANIKAIVSG